MNGFFSKKEAKFGSVECLGQTVPGGQAFLTPLVEILEGPAFNGQGGFPQRTDEAREASKELLAVECA